MKNITLTSNPKTVKNPVSLPQSITQLISKTPKQL